MKAPIVMFLLFLVTAATLAAMPAAPSSALPSAEPNPTAVQSQELVNSTDGWRSGLLDTEGLMGSSIALDTQGNPRVSYVGYGGTLVLKFAARMSSGWAIDTVTGIIPTQIATSLALKGDDSPAILAATSAGLLYVHRDMSGWQVETVANSGLVGGDRVIAVDGADRVHVAYAASAGRMTHAYRDGDGWHAQVIDASSMAGASWSMALDGQDLPHIAYVDTASSTLKVANKDGSGWHVETVGGAQDWPVSLALNSASSSVSPSVMAPSTSMKRTKKPPLSSGSSTAG